MLAADSLLRRALGYRKFSRPQSTVIVLDSGYHLQAECAAALRRLGHHAVSLAVGKSAGIHDASTAMRQLLLMLVETRPDLVLSINQIGFDPQGSMGALLGDAGVPVAVWYADSPFLLYDGHLHAVPPEAHVFVWERTCIPVLQACHVQRVHYLPLGCDTTRFTPTTPSAPTIPLGFVGSSMRYAEHKWRSMLSDAERHEGDAWAKQLLRDRQAFLKILGTPQTPPDRRMITLAYATWMATGWYRQRLLGRCVEAGLQLDVFGDAGWEHVLPAANVHGAVHYGTELAAVYAACVCSFNATSMQMPTAVNQRVFDVFAAGGLALTDRQSVVAELFGDLPYPVYDDADGLVALARYYQTHPEQRARCIEAVRTHILRNHTYEHRLNELLAQVRSATLA